MTDFGIAIGENTDVTRGSPMGLSIQAIVPHATETPVPRKPWPKRGALGQLGISRPQAVAGYGDGGQTAGSGTSRHGLIGRELIGS